MFEIFAVTLPTLGLTYVTATPRSRRQAHREAIFVLCLHVYRGTRRMVITMRWQAAALPDRFRKAVSHDD